MENGGKKLYRSQSNKIFAGIFGGIGEYFDIDPIIIRFLFITLFFVSPRVMIAYFIALFIIPKKI